MNQRLYHSKTTRSFQSRISKKHVEKFSNASPGSCDILASDRGPSCTKLKQIQGRKVCFIRFFSAIENVDHIFAPQEVKRQPFNRAKKSASVLPSHVPNVLECDNYHRSNFEMVSIAHLLEAGTVVKPLKTTDL